MSLAWLLALKGVGNRAACRWISNTYKQFFPRLPERRRLFRLFIETVRSRLTVVCHCQNVMHRARSYLQRRVGYTLVRFNLLVQGHGLDPDAHGYLHLSIAQVSL